MYSSAADVAEMKRLCAEIADRSAASGRSKDRVNAVQKALGLGWNRSLEFLAGKARVVPSWQKDLAREHVAELKRAEDARKAAEHVAFLNRTLAYLKSSDPELYGPHVARIEHGLAAAGVLDRTMAPASRAVEPSDFYDQ